MKISAELQKKLDQLEKYDAAYTNDEELISDAAYDLFKDSVLKQLPPDHPYLDKVGHDICSAWPKTKHFIFMGSQNKVDTEDGIRDYIKKSLQALGIKKARFVLQHKIDGFSLALQYLDKKLDKALTRGKGVVGENIKPNALMFRNVPTVIPIEKEIQVRGEGVLFKEDMDAIQQARIKETGKPYKNARNAASGIGRRYDGSYSKYVRLIPYDINAKVKTETEKVKVLKQLGFSPAMTYTCEDVEEVIAVYKRVKEQERATYPYEIDGLVLKFDELELQEKLGVDHNRPLGQIALKFESEKAFTTILSITLQVGRTGKITPVAILEPVELMGSTITRASLHNFARILEDSTGEGAEVTIVKRGDIIPQVDEVLNIGDVYEKPTKCPSCGGPLVDDSVNLWCRNKECKERDTNRIVYWIETLDIKGFSGKFVEKLWDAGKLRRLSDLYKLKEDDFLSIDGIGEKTIKSFFAALKDSSEMYLSRFIVGLGIESCSKSTAEDLVDNFGTWDKIVVITPADLQKLPGYAEISATTICEGIREVADMAAELLKEIKIKSKKTGPLTGSSFCVTGSLAAIGRKEFYELVVDKGGIAKNSVSEGLTYLVTNADDPSSGKGLKAKKYGVKIINEEEFFKLVGDSPVEKKSDKKEEEKKGTVKLVSENLFG
jgi:DNA ligase (NAD+)